MVSAATAVQLYGGGEETRLELRGAADIGDRAGQASGIGAAKTLAAAGGNRANGPLRIQRIGNGPSVMRWASSAVIESVGDRRRGSDVDMGTGCLHGRS